MTDPNDTPNAAANPAPITDAQGLTTADVGSASAVLGLGGVSAQAVAGEMSPNVDAAPLPAGTAAPEGTTPAPTGPAPDEAAASPTATPGAIDAGSNPDSGAAVAAPAPLVRFAFDTQARKDIDSNLNAIEQMALFWGGETGTKIRNHLGRIRDLLQA